MNRGTLRIRLRVVTFEGRRKYVTLETFHAATRAGAHTYLMTFKEQNPELKDVISGEYVTGKVEFL